MNTTSTGRISLLNAASILSLSLLLSACGGGGGSSDSPSTAETSERVTVQGQILTDGSKSGVSVRTGSQSTSSDASGFFLLEDVSIPDSGRILVEASKNGLVTTHEVVETDDDKEVYTLSISMTEPDAVVSVDLTDPLTVTLNDDQLAIEFPANSVIGGDANSTVSLTYGDPSTDSGKDLFPGDYSATNNPNEPSDIVLESIGFIDVTVTSEDGSDLTQLSEPAEVTIRLPAIYQTGGSQAGRYEDGETIPWWSFDEELGTWVREDADPSSPAVDDAEVFAEDGVLFARAHITHFSWWNLDQPITTHACVTVRVVDAEGSPRQNVLVTAQGISFQSEQSAYTDAQGWASVAVKRTEDSNNPERYRLFASEGGFLKYPYNAPLQEMFGVDTILHSPAQEGSLKNNTGVCETLDNPIYMIFPGTINGVVRNAQGQPQQGVTVYTNLGDNRETDANGAFSLNVPFYTDVVIYIPTLFSEVVMATVDNPIVNLDIRPQNRSPLIDSLTAQPSTLVDQGETITLSVIARDPEQAPLTYAWTASAGTLNTSTGTQVVWTAPSGNGTSRISVTVSDGTNEVSQSQTVRWGTQTPGNLTVSFTNISEPSQLEGISVVLHGADNRSIEQVLEPDDNGVVDFGIINRSTVSFSVIEDIVEGESVGLSVNTTLDAPNTAYFTTARAGDNQESSYVSTYCNQGDRVQLLGRIINAPDNIDSIQIDGATYDSYLAEVPGENEVFPFHICTEAIEAEGYYLVAKGLSPLSSSPEMIAHSPRVYLDAQTSVYVFDLSQTPVTIPTTNTTGSDLTVLVTTPEDLRLGRLNGFSQVVSESITLANFPTEHYLFAAYEFDFDDTRSFSFLRIMDELPESLIFEAPAFSLNNGFQVNEETRTFSWDLENGESVDALSLNLTNGNYGTSWSIMIHPDATTVTLPDLPETIESRLDLDELIDHELSLVDYSNVSDYESQLNSLNGVDDIFEAYLELGDGVSVHYSNRRPDI